MLPVKTRPVSVYYYLLMFFTETYVGSSNYSFNSSYSSFAILRKRKILNMPLPQVCQ